MPAKKKTPVKTPAETIVPTRPAPSAQAAIDWKLTMEDDKHPHLLWLLVVLLIAVAIAFYITGFNNGANSVVPQDTSTREESSTQESSTVDTSSWKIIEGDSYTIKIPSDWVGQGGISGDYRGLWKSQEELDAVRGADEIPGITLSVGPGCAPYGADVATVSKLVTTTQTFTLYTYDGSVKMTRTGGIAPQLPRKTYCTTLANQRVFSLENFNGYQQNLVPAMLDTFVDKTTPIVIPSNWKSYNNTLDRYRFSFAPEWPISVVDIQSPTTKQVNLGGSLNSLYPRIDINTATFAGTLTDLYVDQLAQGKNPQLTTVGKNALPAVVIVSDAISGGIQTWTYFIETTSGFRRIDLSDIGSEKAWQSYAAFLKSFEQI